MSGKLNNLCKGWVVEFSSIKVLYSEIKELYKQFYQGETKNFRLLYQNLESLKNKLNSLDTEVDYELRDEIVFSFILQFTSRNTNRSFLLAPFQIERVDGGYKIITEDRGDYKLKRIVLQYGYNPIICKVIKEIDCPEFQCSIFDFYDNEVVYLPKKITGNFEMSISNHHSAQNVKFILPEYVGGEVSFYSDISEGVILPNVIEGSLTIEHLSSIQGIIWPKQVKSIYLKDITSIDGLIFSLELLNSVDFIYFPDETKFPQEERQKFWGNLQSKYPTKYLDFKQKIIFG